MIRFSVLGEPKPQGSKRAFAVRRKDGGVRAVVTEQLGDALHTWRGRLAAAVAANAPAEGPLAEPVAVLISFKLSAPKRPAWPWPAARGRNDTDKLARAVLDELSGVLIADDSQVVHLSAQKLYGAVPGAEITVLPLYALVDPNHSGTYADQIARELAALIVELVLRGTPREGGEVTSTERPSAAGSVDQVGQTNRAAAGAAPVVGSSP